MQNSNLYSDLDDIENNRIVEVFQPNVCPHLVIIQNPSVYVLELTVCHETNLEKSCKFKTEKYKNLNHFLQPKFKSFPVHFFPFEISVHGFMTNNFKTFLARIKLHDFPLHLRSQLIRTAIFNTFDIYKHRDTQSSLLTLFKSTLFAMRCCPLMDTSRLADTMIVCTFFRGS